MITSTIEWHYIDEDLDMIDLPPLNTDLFVAFRDKIINKDIIQDRCFYKKQYLIDAIYDEAQPIYAWAIKPNAPIRKDNDDFIRFNNKLNNLY